VHHDSPSALCQDCAKLLVAQVIPSHTIDVWV
jgi:hypothetical protein